MSTNMVNMKNIGTFEQEQEITTVSGSPHVYLLTHAVYYSLCKTCILYLNIIQSMISEEHKPIRYYYPNLSPCYFLLVVNVLIPFK